MQVNLLHREGVPADLLPDGRLDPSPTAHPLGDLVSRYAYDAMGRLMWKRTPTNEGLTALQRKDYYYDGVRRIQENITRPTLLAPDAGGGSGGGTPEEPEQLGGPGNDELPMQMPGGGLQQIIQPPELLCEEPPMPLGTLYWTDREYVYGPGYVDEFILQIDRDGNLLYMLLDANYNVVALISGGWCGAGDPPVDMPPPGTLLEQYAYEPYGAVIVADNLDLDEYGVTRHAVNRVGFQGLFFERYDGSYSEPCIAPNVAGMYYARNRFYSPALGRFLQRDPNETGLPIIAALAMNGRAQGILMAGFDASALYGDGMNLYQFAGSNPVNRRDPSGLTDDVWGDFDQAIGSHADDLFGAYLTSRYALAMAMRGVRMIELYTHMAFAWDDFVWDINESVLTDLAAGGLFANACFTADTYVVFGDGSQVPIADVAVGDLILCDFDPENENGPESSLVVATSIRTVDATVELCLTRADSWLLVECTPEHPFYVRALDEFVPASDLAEGASIVTVGGVELTVQSRVFVHARTSVYNLEVAGAHNYYVSDVNGIHQILVHNACSLADIKKIAKGHAWIKHARDWAKLGIKSTEHLATYLGRLAQQAGKALDRGRYAWWDDANGVVLIFDPNNADRGTAFVPPNGKAYFDGL